MARKKPEEHIKPSHAQCWVCLERGIKKMYPYEDLQDCGHGVFRCKRHRTTTIVNAARHYEEEQKAKRFIITIPSIQIEVDVI